jgi:hypothetical protein
LQNQHSIALQLAVYDATFPEQKYSNSDRNQSWWRNANWIQEFVHEQAQKMEPRKGRLFYQALDSIFSGFDVFES